MHFQKGEYAQSKLIRVSNGKILDIMIDLRRNSDTFKKFITIKLESRNKLLYIPKGIAHGFLSLSDNTIINYKCDRLYNPDYESGLNPFKSNLDIDWGIDENDIIISRLYKKKYFRTNWKDVDILIIDEVSMMSAKVLEFSFLVI